MATYISILRGINVGGQKIIRMNDLRKLYENLGFYNIVTYVQSGNIVFTEDEKISETGKLEQKISHQIEKEFGFEVPVIILSTDQLKQIINENPFTKDPDKNQAFLHVTFLSSQPADYDFKAIEAKKQNGEETAFSGNAVYLYCPNGYGKTKLTNNFIEAKLKVGATTRNWKTVNEILKIANGLPERVK